MIHTLKTWPLYFEMAKKGIKPFEIRKNDRDYKVGDIFISKEYDNNSSEYTGRDMRGSICSISTFEQKESIVVLGIIWNDDLEKMKYSEDAIDKLISNIAFRADCHQCPVHQSCKYENTNGCYAEEDGHENEIRRVLSEWSEK